MNRSYSSESESKQENDTASSATAFEYANLRHGTPIVYYPFPTFKMYAKGGKSKKNLLNDLEEAESDIIDKSEYPELYGNLIIDPEEPYRAFELEKKKKKKQGKDPNNLEKEEAELLSSVRILDIEDADTEWYVDQSFESEFESEDIIKEVGKDAESEQVSAIPLWKQRAIEAALSMKKKKKGVQPELTEEDSMWLENLEPGTLSEKSKTILQIKWSVTEELPDYSR
ncbi:hypothetical protein BB560_004338 [Smittium megazygosporum]|uniref:Uncharacterized protein n=1 Tax=Smittium megazygosporum TaxID=133381 RepID=A0A2T9Z9Q2_9FUNG|nr:hypothetical protein BB560_004338 [Smittium megazygosporum]